jgi:hypothetical protein
MTEPKKFKRGKRSYTKWGPHFKEVKVDGGPKPEAAQNQNKTPLTIDVDPTLECGVYSNVTLLHRSSEELILDFSFVPPGQSRGRVRSRVVVSLKGVQVLADLLKKAANEIKAG